jgi:hypothetical protein
VFEFSQENNNGKFSVKLNRELSREETMQVMQFALNLLLSTPTQTPAYGPYQQNHYYDCEPVKIEIPSIPLAKSQYGSYQEPNSGVRLKMLSLNSQNKMAAVKVFRAKTGITIVGSRDVLWGKCFCPRLKPEVAEDILKEFKELNIHAKMSEIYTSAAP